MILQGLHQPPFNATFAGMLVGALRYQGSTASDAWIYGASGYAFLMNIHTELCPSGPYCWNLAESCAQIRNLGIQLTDHGFYHLGSSANERRRVEKTLVAALDKGVPCALLNMEFQLITGYDETGFVTAPIWPSPHSAPEHLHFGSWAEMGDEIHVNYYTLDQVTPADDRKTIVDSLEYAVDLYRNPTHHTEEDYGVGADAWANFIGAVKQGQGASHGNWWNATVWSECRARAADYLVEIAGKYVQARDAATALAADYRAISEALSKISDKELDSQVKLGLLEQAAAREAACVERLGELAAGLGKP